MPSAVLAKALDGRRGSGGAVIYDIGHFDVKVSSLPRLPAAPESKRNLNSAGTGTHRALIGYSSGTRQVEKPAPRST